MRKILAALMLIGVVSYSATAKAMMIAPSPISQRVARSDAVVVGKVTALAEKTEKAEMFKGDERQMQVATVSVEEAVTGRKRRTVKVAFFPPAPPPPAVGGGIRIIRGGRGSVQLTNGQEALFFLTKHPTKKDLYVVQQYFDIVTKTGDPSFTAQRDEAKKYAQVLKEAKTALTSKDGRLSAEGAMMLVARYRSAPAGVTKTEAVPAVESKKMLLALAGGDWNAKQQFGIATPMNTFYLLGLQPKDGWIQPKDGTQIAAEAKKWLEANAGKYKMERYVRESDKKDETEPE